MKKLRITIDGRVYEATVEVLEDDEAGVTGSTAGLPSPLPPRPAPLRAPGAGGPTAGSSHGTAAGGPLPGGGAAGAPPPAPAPSATPAPQAGGPGDPSVVAAPIAGTVQKVFVKQGSRVEAKTPLIMLDAMKMDTYIYAPRTGEIAEVAVKEGDAVQVGTVLLRYRAEG